MQLPPYVISVVDNTLKFRYLLECTADLNLAVCLSLDDVSSQALDFAVSKGKVFLESYVAGSEFAVVTRETVDLSSSSCNLVFKNVRMGDPVVGSGRDGLVVPG